MQPHTRSLPRAAACTGAAMKRGWGQEIARCEQEAPDE
jgi:hypothetical protein